MIRRSKVQKYRGTLLVNGIVVLGVVGMLASILFPVYQKPWSLPNGMVVDGFQKPIPNTTLRIRDQRGRLIADVMSDSDGRFRGTNLSQARVDGYGLVHAVHRSGNTTLYVFAPVGPQTAIFRDANGHLLPGLAVVLQANSLPPSPQVTDKHGQVTLCNLPLSTCLQIKTQSSRQVVAEVRPTRMPQAVYYAVSVTPPATIRGRLLSATGQPLTGYKPFATVGPNVLHHDRISARWLLTGADGRFQIVGLPPGTYYVTAAQTFLPIAPVQRVTVDAGQTKNITLRISL